jgi:nitroreductase
MKTLSPEQLLEQQQWRYAVKKFDSQKKISEKDWKALEESLILTPSSYGIQPWKFLVIKSPDMKATLTPFSWKQSQVADCSHYVVFSVLKKVDEAYITKYVERMAEVRGLEVTQLEGFKKMMVGDVVTGARSHWSTEWAARQAYIALGNFMTSAAILGIDTCPIEGFQPEKYDETLKLSAQGLTSVVCCAAGYRSPEDKTISSKKVRFTSHEMVSYF